MARQDPIEVQGLLHEEVVLYDHQEEETQPLEIVEALEPSQDIMEAPEAPRIIEAMPPEAPDIAEVPVLVEAIMLPEEVLQGSEIQETLLEEVAALEVPLPEAVVAGLL